MTVFGLGDLAFLGAATPAASLLLDLYPNAAAAYSLRLLRSAYTGAVVRVRRSNDNAEQDFTATQVTDGTLATFCGGNDGQVAIWYDQSGNGFHATSASNSVRIVVAGTLATRNNKPTILFNVNPNDTVFGSGGILSAQFQLSFGFTAFFVLRPNSSTPGTTDRFAGNSPSGQFRFNGGKLNWVQNNADGPSVAGKTQMLATYMAPNSSQMNMAINGSPYVATNGSFSISTQNTYGIGGPIGSTALTGDMQEVIVYSSDQSSTRAAIESNINAHYAIY